MQVNTLTHSLPDRLISINDENLLERINQLIENADLEKTVVKVSKQQSKMLTDSEDDIKNGKLVSDEKLNEEEQRWLNGQYGLIQQ